PKVLIELEEQWFEAVPIMLVRLIIKVLYAVTSKNLIFGGFTNSPLRSLLFLAGDKLNWFGRLPGDIRVEKENFKFYFPVTSLILISVLLNLLIFLVRKFWN